MTSVVVLVLAWNGADYLRPCLRALAAQAYPGRYAVLVVDNGSSDGSARMVRDEFPDVALLQNRSNLGFGAGNNVGLRALLAGAAPAPADFVPDLIVLLNQDTEVEAGWLAALVAACAEEQPDTPPVGIVGCKIFFPDGETLQHTGGSILWPVGTGLHRGTGEADTGQYDQTERVEYVTGAALAVRSVVLRQIGLFDEGFAPAYFEDVDLCYRARAAGFDCCYTPAARLRHDESTSLEGQSARHQRAYHRNRLRFVLKHAPLDQLLDAFAPAEHEEIARWSLSNSLARKHAYLDALLVLPAVLPQRSDAAAALPLRPRLVDLLRGLHSSVVAEEQHRRSESAYQFAESTPPAPAAPLDEPTPEPAPEPAPAPAPEPAPESTEAAEETVDVAAIMRQVRRRISERQGQYVEHELDEALDKANQQWNAVYAPLELEPGASLPGRLWELVRMRLHHEVRGYLDGMIYRQTEFNASVVRALNGLLRRSNATARTSDLETLRDEVIQLREQVRQLQEARDQRAEPGEQAEQAG